MNGQIGYTDDGMVFMTILSQFEGKPTQTLIQMSVEQAKSLCKEIANAAHSAEKLKEKKAS